MTKKAYLKRVKITKTGKVLRRTGHQGHNQAKETPKVKRQRRKIVSFSAYAKKIKRDTF
ncbi:MAG: 50S ribosomal protein L35 [Minisyncoccia bacterium]